MSATDRVDTVPQGLLAYGVYLPYWRLERGAVHAVLGTGGGKGARTVASFDEDTTTMGVEAARRALAAAGETYRPRALWFATADPAYLDKTNAIAVREALALPPELEVADALGSVRSGLGAARAALYEGGLAVLADVRTGRPGSAEEIGGGDAATALAFGSGPGVIATLRASATSTGEFLDRWRTPGHPYSQVWEERFGEVAYLEHVESAWARLLGLADLAATDIDHVVITGLHARANRAAAAKLGVDPKTVADDLTASIGNTGTAHWALVFADVLDRAGPGQTIAVLTVADGCSAQLWQTTEAVETLRPAVSVRDRIAEGIGLVPYARFLTWRGFLDREPPRRPEPDRPAAPPSRRSAAWKFGLNGSVDETGFVHLPPSRVSLHSGSVDRMTPVPMVGVRGHIATFTVDRLAYSLSPPVVAAVIDFEGGGRFPLELTDVDAEQVRIGDRVEMTFRRLYTQGGVHNYFWKARPSAGGPTTKAGGS
jgi:hydroxymethylglutaryl-CoA synthase